MLKRSLLIVLCVLSIGVYAEELTDEKKRIIDELLEITGAAEMGETMAVFMANEMISAMTKKYENSDDPRIPRMIEITKDETAKLLHEEFIANRWFNEISYGLYHKYLSTAELKELLAFWKTPIGRKLIVVTPKITEEGMSLGVAHGRSLGPAIKQRLKARLEREGLLPAE